jgi:hypothetical protein
MTLADEMFVTATLDPLQECARLLAMSVGHYQAKHRELPA